MLTGHRTDTVSVQNCKWGQECSLKLRLHSTDSKKSMLWYDSFNGAVLGMGCSIFTSLAELLPSTRAPCLSLASAINDRRSSCVSIVPLDLSGTNRTLKESSHYSTERSRSKLSIWREFLRRIRPRRSPRLPGGASRSGRFCWLDRRSWCACYWQWRQSFYYMYALNCICCFPRVLDAINNCIEYHSNHRSTP